MHARLVEDHPVWEDRIEVAYVPALALWNFRTQTNQIAVVSLGEPFHLKAAGKDWLMNWHTVREVGLTLYSPTPLVLIPEISQSEFVEAVREQAEVGENGYTSRARQARSPTPFSPCARPCTRRRLADNRRRSRRRCGNRIICRSGPH